MGAAASAGMGIGVAQLPAAIVFWDGGGSGGTGNNWSVTANWATVGTSGTNTDTATIPGSGDDVVFYRTGGARLTTGLVNQASTIASLTFGNGQSGTVTVGGSSALTISGKANYNPALLSSGAGGNLGTVGIYVQSGAGAATVSAPITLGGAQQWINNSSNLLSVDDVSNGANTLTIAGTGNTTIGGVLGNGAGGLIKSGSGTLTLSGTNTFTGQMSILDGVVSIASINNSATTGVLGNSANAVILGSNGTTGTLLYTSASTSSSKKFTMATGGGGVIQVSSSGATLTLSGLIDGSGVLTKAGAGTLTLSNTANTFSGGLTITGGTVTVGGSAGGNMLGSGTVTMANNTDINLVDQNGNNVNTGLLKTSGDGTGVSIGVTGNNNTATLVINGTGTETFAGIILENGGNGNTHTSLNKAGAGIQILTGSNTYDGGTTISDGILVAGHANALGTAGTISNSATLAVGSGITFTRAVTFNNGSTLAGLGTYTPGSTVTLATGRTIAPGIANGANDIGTLSMGNNVAFSSGSTFSLEVGAGANNNDKLAVTGTAAITAGANISISGASANQGVYTLLTSTGALSGTFTGSAPTGYKLVYQSNQLLMQHQAVQTLAPITGTVNIIAGQSLAISGTLSNTAPSGSAALAIGLGDNSGTLTVGGLTPASGTVSPGGSTTVNGTIANVGAAGMGKTWNVKNTDSNALTSPVSMSGTVNVYDHSAAALTVASGNSQTVIVGAAGITATLNLANGTTGQALLAGLDVNTLSSGLTGTTGSNVIASGASGNYTAALATNTLGTNNQGFSLKAGDEQTITGASALSTLSANVSLTVIDHAAPSFNNASPQNSLTITINGTDGTGLVDGLPFSITNLSGLRSNLKLTGIDSVLDNGNPTALTLDPVAVSGLAQGGSTAALLAHVDTTNSGSYTNVYTLHFSDDSALAGAGALQDLVLTVNGNVTPSQVPEPMSLMLLGLGSMAMLVRRRRLV